MRQSICFLGQAPDPCSYPQFGRWISIEISQAVISLRISGAYIHPIDEGDGVKCPEDGQQSMVDLTHESLFISSTVDQRRFCLDSAVLRCGLRELHGFFLHFEHHAAWMRTGSLFLVSSGRGDFCSGCFRVQLPYKDDCWGLPADRRGENLSYMLIFPERRLFEVIIYLTVLETLRLLRLLGGRVRSGDLNIWGKIQCDTLPGGAQ